MSRPLMVPFLVLVAVVSWGIWAVALRKAVEAMPPLAAYVIYTVAGVLLIPAYLGLARAWNTPLRYTVIGSAWASLAAILVGIGTLALVYAMRERDTSEVVALTACYPLVTLVLALVFLGESLTVARVFGVLAIAVGAYLLSR